MDGTWQMATPEQHSLLEEMLFEYLEELDGVRGLTPSKTSRSYPFLAYYWQEPDRYALWLERGGANAGFALVRGPGSTETEFFEMAEFYVLPAHRGVGFAHKAALGLLEQFGGPWRIEVDARNERARRFWRACAQAYVSDVVSERPFETIGSHRLRICLPKRPK